MAFGQRQLNWSMMIKPGALRRELPVNDESRRSP